MTDFFSEIILNEEKKKRTSVEMTDAGSNQKDRSPRAVFQVRFSVGAKPRISVAPPPLTPLSTLFLHPKESPHYAELNENLLKVYQKLSDEIEDIRISKQTDKIINVKNTSSSSLMLRRNKSERSLILQTLM